MAKENLHTNYIAPIIVGIFLLFISLYVFDLPHSRLEEKDEINYHFDQANNFYKHGQFEEAIGEYNEILKYHTINILMNMRWPRLI